MRIHPVNPEQCKEIAQIFQSVCGAELYYIYINYKVY